MEKLKEQASDVKTIQVLMSLPKRKPEWPRVDHSLSELFEEDESPSPEQVELAHLWKELEDYLEFLKVREASVTIKRPLYKQDPCCWDENDAMIYEEIGLRCRHCGEVIQEKYGEDTSHSRM